MKKSWFGIRIVAFLTVIVIAGFYQILSNTGIDLDTAFNTIALILFISIMAYYLLPKTQGRRHRTAKPKHKQYNDSRLTDRMMERIMEIYGAKEEIDNTEEQAEDNIGFDRSINGGVDKQSFKRKSDTNTESPTEKGIVEEVIEEQTDVNVKHTQYNDSLLTDYMMSKIMKAYNVQEEADSEEEEEESNIDEFEEDTPPSQLSTTTATMKIVKERPE